MLMRLIVAITVLIAASFVIADEQHFPIEVAIIIDDLGYSRERGLAALDLPGDVTFAVIPHSPNARFLATQAQERDKEIILHAPMSNVHDYPIGELGLNDSMDEEAFNEALTEAIASVPYIRGVNNHMGSLLTQQPVPMKWMMSTLEQQGLYFVDSRTTSRSIAWKTAQEHNVPSLKRDVFLDHEQETSFIHEQFEHFIAIAKRRGYAIAIAHPYPETLAYLQQNLSRLAAEGITLVPASHLVYAHSPNRQQIQAKM